LSIVQRWYSSRIGEGLIYDLRVALFDKVQHMPIAFFTRTQTGALISRLNNDVVGAQTAVTGTLGSVVSNVVVLVTTLGAMLALEWRLTVLSLVVHYPRSSSWRATARHLARTNGTQCIDEHADD
jgi:ATP-binding cassette subfamily B protein